MMGRPWQKCRTSEIHCKNKSCQHATRHVGWQSERAAYLLLDVVERVGRVDGETDQDDMRVRVGERAQSVVIFLASGIPEGELDVLAIDFDIGDVVLEDGGDVNLWTIMLAHRVQ